MALHIRASVSTAGSGLAVPLTIPLATQPGDYILEFLEAAATNVVQTPPAGWTAVTSITIGNSSSSLRAAQRTAQAGDGGAAAAFSIATNTRWSASIIVIYDDAAGVPRIEQVTQSSSGAGTSSPSTPAIDPASSDDILLAVFGGTSSVNGEQPTLTANASFNLETQATSNSVTLKNAVLGIGSWILPDGNAITAKTHSSSLNLAPVGASVLVSFHNVTPIANAGSDQIVDPGVVVTLDGTASSDFDGTITGYAWTQISGTAVTLSNPNVAQPTFTSPSSVNGAVLVFGLTVTDNESSASAQDTVTITVGATAFQHVWNGTTWRKEQIRSRVGGTWIS